MYGPEYQYRFEHSIFLEKIKHVRFYLYIIFLFLIDIALWVTLHALRLKKNFPKKSLDWSSGIPDWQSS